MTKKGSNVWGEAKIEKKLNWGITYLPNYLFYLLKKCIKIEEKRVWRNTDYSMLV